MKIGRLRGLPLPLLLLLGMGFSVNGGETISSFIKDVIATFRLASPTIVYDREEAPEICYEFHWVLCLPLQYQETESEELANSGKFAVNILKISFQR